MLLFTVAYSSVILHFNTFSLLPSLVTFPLKNKQTVACQRWLINGEILEIFFKSRTSWERCLKASSANKSLRITSTQNGGSPGSEGRRFPSACRESGRYWVCLAWKRNHLHVCEAWLFQSEIFSEWIGRKRDLNMVKQWEGLYLNINTAHWTAG